MELYGTALQGAAYGGVNSYGIVQVTRKAPATMPHLTTYATRSIRGKALAADGSCRRDQGSTASTRRPARTRPHPPGGGNGPPHARPGRCAVQCTPSPGEGNGARALDLTTPGDATIAPFVHRSQKYEPLGAPLVGPDGNLTARPVIRTASYGGMTCPPTRSRRWRATAATSVSRPDVGP